MGPLPDFGGALAALVVFAVCGMLALVCGAGAGLLVWWLLTHVTVVVA